MKTQSKNSSFKFTVIFWKEKKTKNIPIILSWLSICLGWATAVGERAPHHAPPRHHTKLKAMPMTEVNQWAAVTLVHTKPGPQLTWMINYSIVRTHLPVTCMESAIIYFEAYPSWETQTEVYYAIVSYNPVRDRIQGTISAITEETECYLDSLSVNIVYHRHI